jgi:hypothetical protein
MKTSPLIRPLFYVAGLYDGLLGLFFLIKPLWLYEIFEVTPPNHVGYVQFPAALLVTFGIMFFAIGRDPDGKRGLIPYGMLLKISFCSVAFYHWIASGIPNMWKPFAIADLVFLFLFVFAYFMGYKTPKHRTC